MLWIGKPREWPSPLESVLWSHLKVNEWRERRPGRTGVKIGRQSGSALPPVLPGCLRLSLGGVISCARIAVRYNQSIAPCMCWKRQNRRRTMEIKLTAVFQKVPEGYIGFVEELPGANTQGMTLEETRENLREAVELVLEANRILSEESLAGQDVIREPLLICAA